MKVRFVGGPMGGKSKEVNVAYGTNEIVMRDKKRMTRKQQWEFMRANQGQWQYAGTIAPNGGSVFTAAYGPVPIVESRYRIAMRIHPYGSSLTTVPCMHPDGSLFYEYVEGSKREL